MSKLQELLGAELFASVTEKMGGERVLAIVKGDGADGTWIPKEKFAEATAEVTALKGQMTERDAQMVTLTEAAKGNEALTAKIAEMDAANVKATEDQAAAILTLNRDHALSDGLKAAGALNTRAIAGLLDMEKVTFADGKLTGLDEQIVTLKESDGYLFGDAAALESARSNNRGTGGHGVNVFTKEHFNLTEQGRLLKEQPELAATLQAEANA